MIVVSNASPLITLARIEAFSILERLFSGITISREVYAEVVERGAGSPGAAETSDARWITTKDIIDRALFDSWRSTTRLGAGEIATILLAKEIAADLTLIDERKARLIAQKQRLKVIGSVGLLELGYRKKYINDLRGSYKVLLEQGIRVERRILDASLTSVGLSPL